jgi:hypothetical protein
LLEIKIVASNFLGSSNNSSMSFKFFGLLFSFAKSVLEMEKKATSVPEIKADITSSNIRAIIP